jgi:hypothetical protein
MLKKSFAARWRKKEGGPGGIRSTAGPSFLPPGLILKGLIRKRFLLAFYLGRALLPAATAAAAAATKE